MRSIGFVVEPVRRESIPLHLEGRSAPQHQRPEVVLLAPEYDRRRRPYFGYNLAAAEDAHDLVGRIRDLPDRLSFADDVRA